MKLYSNILGEGAPLLILHGFLGMSDNWKTLGKEFADAGFQVHLIDQRNHGRSPHSEDFSYLLMAKDIKEYCDAHKLENCILLGHSMGGKTAMLAASLFPHIIEKLIVADIAPKYYAPHHQQILEGLQAVDRASLSSRGEAEDLLSQYVKEAGVRLFLLKNLYWKSKGKLALRFNLDSLVQNVENVGEALPEDAFFSKPTLFLRGGNSNYITSEDIPLIKSHFPEAEVETIPNVGHWLHAENKDAFFTAVMRFL
ncbi:alpha/beta fold hydrolase [Salinimicrobium gaetbulicola]|uniref:Alpha/beta fold hydrolase n=1 Tax=Salinimicrobium gaetbulicola TaxID=999702 RepID=A0ABW3IEY8_9FLAO